MTTPATRRRRAGARGEHCGVRSSRGAYRHAAGALVPARAVVGVRLPLARACGHRAAEALASAAAAAGIRPPVAPGSCGPSFSVRALRGPYRHAAGALVPQLASAAAAAAGRPALVPAGHFGGAR